MISSIGRDIRPTARMQRGFTIVELMVAMLVGILLVFGMVALFESSSRVNQFQDALSRLQENGRFAISRVSEDLRLATYLYCSGSGGNAVVTSSGAGKQDQRRPVRVLTADANLMDASDRWGDPTAATDDAYMLSPRYLLQGYECSTGTCDPALPSLEVGSWPAVGTADGQMADSTDVLTVRYLDGSGWGLASGNSSLTCTGNVATAITLAPAAHESASNFVDGDVAMMSDCNSFVLFSVNATLGIPDQVAGSVPCLDTSGDTDVRVFNFTRDYRTVTYYLQLNEDPATPGRMISSLMRRVNGGPDASATGGAVERIADGVERLDFLYAVETGAGRLAYMSADEVTANPDGLACPPRPPGLDADEPGCLWRAVRGIEIFMLMNSVNQIALSDEERRYRYSFDNGGDITTPPGTLPSGLPSESMVRREFRAQVSVRNNVY